MKKILISTALIFSFAITAIAQNPTAKFNNPEYPDLYTKASITGGERLPNGQVITYVVMTIPFWKVGNLEDGTYAIVHPVIGNESEETTTIIKDSDMDGLYNLFQFSLKHPEAIKEMTVSVKLKYIDGISTDQWSLYASSVPSKL